MSDDQSGFTEHQVTFYRVAGHSHNGEDSSRIDFSTYDILDVIDMGQLQSIIVNTVQNSVLTTNSITVGGGGNSIVIDGSTPSTPGGLSVSSSASTISDGNIYIDASWSGDDDGSNITYRVKLEKSDNGSAGTYYVSQTAETSELSHRFEWIDNASSDGSTIYYKVSVYAISPLGVISTPTTSSAIAPAVDSTAPARPVFNNTLTGFDEGVNPTFKGFFVQLVDNSEFDVKDGRGQYEFQVSISNNPLNGAEEFDDANKMKASGSSKSNFFLINNLAVRASAGASKTDYYLRVRAKDSSGNTSPWTYYRNTSDGGSSGAGTTDVTLSSAINVLEVAGGVDIEANSITANDILAGTITATQIAAGTITASNIAAGTITGTQLSASVVEVGDTISSSNYDNTSGSEAGWQLHSDGSAILNNLTARGGVYATTGEIGSGADTWTIGAGTMQANSGSSSLILSAAGTVPFIRMGSKTAYDDTNAGVWIDPANGLTLGSGTTGLRAGTDGSFYLGATTGSYVQWDGSTFTVSGDITGGTIDIGTESFHVNSDGDMWLGASTYASAPFKVSKLGALSAISGTFSGSITGATGAFAGTLSASNITSGTIDASSITVSNLNADNITSGTIAAARIDVSALTITGADITSGSFPGSSYVFKGSGTARVTFNTSTSISSSIKFGTTTDDDAFGSINYGSGTFGGFSYDGIGIYNNAQDNYILLQNTGNSPHIRLASTSNMLFNLESGGASLNDILDVWGDIRLKHNLVVGSDSAAPGGFGLYFVAYGNSYIGGDLTVTGGVTSTGSIVPASTATYINATEGWTGSDIGSSSKFWDDVYSKSGINTSDVNMKENIQNASLGLEFIKGLRPVSFTWKEGATGKGGARKHHGFIAQEVETLLGDDAPSTALWIDGSYDEEEHWKHADIESGDPDGKSKVTVESGSTQGIRYTELIAPIVKAIQEMEARLSALES